MKSLGKMTALGILLALAASPTFASRSATDYSTTLDAHPSPPGTPEGALTSAGTQVVSPNEGAGPAAKVNSMSENSSEADGKLAGNPIDITKGSTVIENLTDLSIPVKHGLTLDVKRTFSSRYSNQKSKTGQVGLGFCNDTDIPSNWELSYEPRVVYDTSEEGEMVLWQGYTGGDWVHFGFDQTQNFGDGNKLRNPYASGWNNSHYVSIFYPVGDPRCNSPFDGGIRQTGEDITFFILHAHNPSDEEDRVDPDNVLEVVLRFADGRQFHYDNTGVLRFMDANWRNNKAYGASGHVDDYLTINWYYLAQSRGTGNPCKTIKEVIAPPSDGRKLVFNHLTYDAGPPYKPYAEITSVSLVAGGNTYDDLVRYEYCSSATIQEGRLWRVWNGDNVEYGVQYDYGEIFYFGGWTILYGANYPQDLCLISEVYDDASPPFPTEPLIMNVRWFGSAAYNMIQCARDPNTGDWRARFQAIGTADSNLYWKDGQILTQYYASSWTNTNTRYSAGSSNTYTLYEQGTNDDVDSLDYANADQTPPLLEQTFHSGAGGQNRLVNETKINIDGDWVTEKDLDYDSYASGIGKVTKVTKYPKYEDNGGGTWVADTDTKQETSLAYSDSDNLEEPSSVVSSNGHKAEYNYNSSGQIATMTEKQKDLNDGSFDTVAVTTYTYLTTGVNSGLVSQIEYDPVVGETKTITCVYADSDGGYFDGQTISVTADDHTTTYTYNDFSQKLTTETEDGIAENTYSTTWLPPRLETVEDITGVLATYLYNDRGQVWKMTEADGETEERLTTYSYDMYGRQTVITAPDNGQTTSTFDVYNNLQSIEDAKGTITKYVYDAFGRVTKETVTGGGGDIYNTLYTFVEDSSGCGSCGGGGAMQIATKSIGDGATTETLYFKYDLLGRKIGEGTDSDADDMVYTYDDTKLITVTHNNGSSLWGTSELGYAYDNYNRLISETYPNGRTIEFAYDSGTPAARLTAIKDPFGYMTDYAYAADDKLTTLTHSSLGSAVFGYDGQDRLEHIRNGNGAYTDYDYDAYGRLISFDIRESGDAQMLKHSWDYDNLQRKSDIDIDSDLVADIDAETIDIGYDSMSRLSQEKLTDGGGAHWDMDYEYDDIGNRTRRNDNTGAPGDISFTYDTGNREATVTDSIDPLEYDFKGNVKGRMTLDGNRVYHYAWNAWDRLTSATLVTGGDHTVNYTYDAQGRMLGRLKSGDSYATVNYWLGLNKIAEEIATDLSAVVRPDDEATEDPIDAGWMNYGEELSDAGDENSYETDPVRGKYFHAEGDGLFGSGVAFIGDSFGSDVNPYDSEFDTEHHVVGLWFRNNNTGDPITIQIGARNAGDDPYSFDLITDDGSDGGGQYYLGAALNDGQWHYAELDLAEAWGDASYGGVFGHVDSLALIGADLDADLDDIILSGGKLGKSYQLNRDAQISAYMGVQSGSEGGESQAAWSKWYHHYNDLGTVQVTSNYAGTLIAASEPDFYGNYQHVYGTRPDTMGITSKFYDPDMELNYFNARWYDSGRGRWTSKDLLTADGLNLYCFVRSSPVLYFDVDGLRVSREEERRNALYASAISTCAHTCHDKAYEAKKFAKKTGVKFDCNSNAHVVAECMGPCMTKKGYTCSTRVVDGWFAPPIFLYHAVAQVKCKGYFADRWRTIDRWGAPLLVIQSE